MAVTEKKNIESVFPSSSLYRMLPVIVQTCLPQISSFRRSFSGYSFCTHQRQRRIGNGCSSGSMGSCDVQDKSVSSNGSESSSTFSSSFSSSSSSPERSFRGLSDRNEREWKYANQGAFRPPSPPPTSPPPLTKKQQHENPSQAIL